MERFAGRYGLLKKLGSGGMGDVFLAVDLDTGAEYALKRLVRPSEAASLETLRREFEALAQIRHPSVVRVVELGFDFEGVPFLVMELVPGWPADQVVRPGDWDELGGVAARVASGLEAVHAAGIAHGDLKPQNILVGPAVGAGGPRDVRLVDFGLAALDGTTAQGHRGTAGFTAPEVVLGAAPDAGADLYAFGATLFALASGRPPFEGQDPGTLLHRQQAGPPSALRLEEAGVPKGWVQLILHLMATERAERPRGATDVRRAIERLTPAAKVPLAERLRVETLIGREMELARAERARRHAERGARALFITGESGTGKTALLDALAIRGALEGRGVIRVSGAAGTEPASAWRAAMRRLAAEARVDLAAAPAELRAALQDGAPAPDDLAVATVLEPMAEWCRIIAARAGPACVLIDDAEMLDATSRRAFRRALLAREAAPALWVMARRGATADLGEEERLLVEAGAAESFELSALPREAVARLAASRLQIAAAAELVDFLWDRAAGHPGLTVEALRAAAEAGALREEEFGVRVDGAALAAMPVAADFEASRIRRLNELSAPARSAAHLLAAVGRPASLARLRRIEPALAESTLEALRGAQLAARDGDGQWGLTPPALGARLLRESPGEELRRLHAAILAGGELTPRERFAHRRGAGDAPGALADAEAAFEADSDPALATIAADLAAGSDLGLAARWLERAGRAFMDRGRYRDAAPLVERALELDVAPAARPDRWGMLTTCRIRTGDLDGVARDAERARREPLTDAALALVMVNEGARLIALGRSAEALTVVREAAGIAERAAAWRVLGNARISEAIALMHLDRLRDAGVAATGASKAFERDSFAFGVTRAAGLMATVIWRSGRIAESDQIYREALSEARRLQFRVMMEELGMGHSAVLVTMGRWAEARAAQAEALRVALEDGRPLGTASGMAELALIDGLMGAIPLARVEAKRAIVVCRAHFPQSLSWALRAGALALRIAGRLSRARRLAVRALELSRRASFGEEEDWCLIELARIESRQNRWKQVAEITEAALGRGGRAGKVADVALAALAGRAALRLGGAETPAGHLARIEAWPVTASGAYAAALTAQLRAEISLNRPNSNRGGEAAENALAAFASLPASPERTLAALEFARLAIARRSAGSDLIQRWLDQAVAGFERLGDRGGREQALATSVMWLREARAEAPSPGRDRNLIEVVGRLLDSMADFSELTQRAMQLAVEQLDAERGVLLLADPETGRLEACAEHGALDASARREAASFSRRAVERVAESGGSLLIRDAPTDPKAATKSVLELKLRSILCVPMFRGGRVIGAVYLDDSRRRDAFGEGDRSLIEGFAQLMAIAIENSRGHEEVRRTNEQLVGENLLLRQEMVSRFHPGIIVGSSAAMVRVMAMTERAALGSSTVLLTGENGTGKEMIARILHHSGKRKLGPFVAVNCGAIPETLLASELFGHVRGAFTGAVENKKGRFEQADGGTLFLDEIGEMPLLQQVALLSVISNREVSPVGGGKPISVDVRIIAATNQDLRRLISEGKFREDLFYRLNVIPIHVPPLRERKADIPSLARHFTQHFAKLQEREVPEMSPEFMAAIMQSDWPGNVRELQNYIERVMAMTPGGVLNPTPLPRDLEESNRGAPRGSGKRRLADQVAELEHRAITQALERAEGNQSLAARELGMTEQSLRYRLKKYEDAGLRKIQRVRKKRRKP